MKNLEDTFGVDPENRTEVLLDDLRYELKRLNDELERQRERDEKGLTISDDRTERL